MYPYECRFCDRPAEFRCVGNFVWLNHTTDSMICPYHHGLLFGADPTIGVPRYESLKAFPAETPDRVRCFDEDRWFVASSLGEWYIVSAADAKHAVDRIRTRVGAGQYAAIWNGRGVVSQDDTRLILPRVMALANLAV